MSDHAILDNADKQADKASTQLSTLIRATTLALIGVIWLYAGGLSPSEKFDTTLAVVQAHIGLNVALVALIVCLGLDIFQYACATVLWQWWKRSLIRMTLTPTSQTDRQLHEKAWSGPAGKFLRSQINNAEDIRSLGLTPATWTYEELRAAFKRRGLGGPTPLKEPLYPSWFNLGVSTLMTLKFMSFACGFIFLIIAFA